MPCCCNLSLLQIYKVIILFFETIVFIQLFICSYLAFIGIVYLTFSLLFYEWISLITKDFYIVFISILANLSDFGFFFFLSVFFVTILPNAKDIQKLIKSFIIFLFNKIIANRNSTELIKKLVLTVCFIVILSILLAIISFLCIAMTKWLFEVSVTIECIFLILYFLFPIISLIKKSIRPDESEFSPIDDDQDDNSQNNQNENKFLSTIINVYNIFSLYKGMFDNTYGNIRFYNHQLLYKIIIIIIISILQLYSLIYPLITGSISLTNFFIFLISKAMFIIVIFSYNIIDMIFNFKRVLFTLKKDRSNQSDDKIEFNMFTITYFCVIIFYALIIVAVLLIYCLSKMNIFPSIKNAIYIDNQQYWFKLNKFMRLPHEGFCSIKAINNDLLKTEDYAMLTTLPRLYGSTDDGKCFIKPSMRGLFNSTMKYIFGKDYENDGIDIYCKKLVHNIILVITSDKLMNQTLKQFSDPEKFIFLHKKPKIINSNYFDQCQFKNLSKEGENLLTIYKDCVSKKGTPNCENEWDNFTQYYWPNYFSDDYADLPGFERYQMTIDKSMIFQPSFISNDGQKYAGLHYIVGGSSEDEWGVKTFVEAYGRNKMYNLLKQLPFIDDTGGIFLNSLIKLDLFNKFIFYSNDGSAKEMTELLHLFSQFNFSHQFLYAIGHSILGNYFKGLSYTTDIRGIVFESSVGLKNVNTIPFSKITLIHSNNNIKNIYSKSAIISSDDSHCNFNGILPSRYYFPSVYDTACLTAITCSETMKYVPFCEQVLNQNGRDPIKEFNKSFNAYMNFVAN